MPLDPDLTEFTTASQAIRTYNAVDFLTGRGIATFYGCDYEDGTYGLSTAVFYSNKGFTGTGTTNQANDADAFEVVFTVNPMDVDGDVIINVPIYLFNARGSDYSPSTTVTATLSHVDKDANVTVLGTVSGGVSVSLETAEAAVETFAGKINVSQLFGQGETMKLRVQTTAATYSKIFIGHDPGNRDLNVPVTPSSGGWDVSQLKILVPVRTNL